MRGLLVRRQLPRPSPPEGGKNQPLHGHTTQNLHARQRVNNINQMRRAVAVYLPRPGRLIRPIRRSISYGIEIFPVPPITARLFPQSTRQSRASERHGVMVDGVDGAVRLTFSVRVWCSKPCKTLFDKTMWDVRETPVKKIVFCELLFFLSKLSPSQCVTHLAPFYETINTEASLEIFHSRSSAILWRWVKIALCACVKHTGQTCTKGAGDTVMWRSCHHTGWQLNDLGIFSWSPVTGARATIDSLRSRLQLTVVLWTVRMRTCGERARASCIPRHDPHTIRCESVTGIFKVVCQLSFALLGRSKLWHHIYIYIYFSLLPEPTRRSTSCWRH